MSLPKSKAIDSWASLLEKELKATEKRPSGDGWFTAKELQKQYNVGEKKIHYIINKLVGEDKCERFAGWIYNESKAKSSRVWYKLKSK
jgi:hypothetical protein